MNIAELENRILEKENDLKNEINKVEFFLSSFSIEKFSYFRSMANWLIYITYCLICFGISVFIKFDNIDLLHMVLILSSALFFLYFYFMFFENIFLNFVCYILNKGINENIYKKKISILLKLNSEFSRFNENKIICFSLINKFYETIKIRDNLSKDESNFISLKKKWE